MFVFLLRTCGFLLLLIIAVALLAIAVNLAVSAFGWVRDTFEEVF